MTKRFHMRVALLSAEYPPTPGGVGDYTRQLGKALVARGHQVWVLTIYDLRFVIYDLNSGDAQFVGSAVNHKAPWGWQSWRTIGEVIGMVRPDVLHIQYQTGAYGMHPAINFLPWWMRRSRQRPTIVVTTHDLLEPYLFPKAGPLRAYVTHRLLNDADAAIVTNQDDWATVAGWSGRNQNEPPACIPIGSNIAVALPPDYDRDVLRAQLGVGESDTLLAYFGLLGRSKGVDTLVGALAQLPQTTRLVIIGGEASAPQDRAYAEAVRAQIATLGGQERVVITGQLDEAAVSAHLLAADIAALPFSDGATFRRGSLLAALAHGLPVVTTEGVRRGAWGVGLGMPTFEDGKNVLLVPPGDAAALAAAITRLTGDRALRARLGAAGAALAAQFAWPRIAEQHEAVYHHPMDAQAALT